MSLGGTTVQRLAALLVTAAAVLAGCGSAVPGNPSAAPAPAVSAADRPGLLDAALLRPSEIGPRWSKAAERPVPDASSPAVCGGPNVVSQFPNAHRVGTALVSDAGERMQETLSVFADTATATSAFDAYATGLNCPQGKLGATPVAIGAPEDVTRQVQGDRATAWSITGESFGAVLVSVAAGEHLVNFVFLTPKGGTLTRLDALALARTGVARLLAT